eukprot:4004561-Pyramimonas_sp.AAC.1
MDLYLAAPNSHDNLTPVGVIPRDRGGSISSAPIVFRSSGTMMINQISFVIIMPASSSRLGS